MKKLIRFSLLSVIVQLLILGILIGSCESQVERQQRLAQEQKKKAELVAQQAEEQKRLEAERERQREEQETKDRYINNSLATGSTPYQNVYGRNYRCSDWGCSQIKVITPNNSDVLVTIKRGASVVRHAYIKKSSSFIFEMPNGTYQPFFYYGQGWNPNKIMKQTSEGTVQGGFVEGETFGKDSPQPLNNAVLTYELILQQNGNFSTRPSSASEAF